MEGMFPVLASPQLHHNEGFTDWWWDNVRSEAWICDPGFSISRGRDHSVDMIPSGLFLFKDKAEALLFKLTWGGDIA